MDVYTAFGRTVATTPTNPKSIFLALFATWWVLLAFFYAVPGVDIAVANHFFTPFDCANATDAARTCGVFLFSKSAGLKSLRDASMLMPYGIALLLAGLLVRGALSATRDSFRQQFNAIVVALIALALGSGLLVNGVLKAFWGRPRPRDTLFFGGHFDFVQAGSMAGKCLDNCSFVSGEAATAGWLFCLIWLFPKKWRPAVGIPIAAISIGLTLLRVAFGAHYLSDAVLGWLSSLVIFAGVVAFTGGWTVLKLSDQKPAGQRPD